MNQHKFVERLDIKQRLMREQNVYIEDITVLYTDFVEIRTTDWNYIWRKQLRPFLKKYFQKRLKKGDFNRKLFALAIFNNLYSIRQNRNDLIPFGCNENSDYYRYLANHQYVRKELEKLNIEDIIILSYSLAKTFRK